MSDYQNGQAEKLKAEQWQQHGGLTGLAGQSGLAGMLQRAPPAVSVADLVEVQRGLLCLLGIVNDLMQRLGSR